MLVRLLSAFIALPFVLLLFYLGSWPFLGLILFAGSVCLFEHMSMTMPGDRVAQIFLTILGSILIVLTMVGALTGLTGMVAYAFLPVIVFCFFLFRTGDLETVASRVGFGVLGIVWAGGLIAATGCLRLLPEGIAWLVLACILSWLSDTGAYFSGRFLGKHKLYEKVSPKKTWEGAIGGVIAATIGAFVLRELYGPKIETMHLAVIAPVGAALGQVGDLAESLLKRSVGVKDSGKIMPGHGGLLDRVDALVFVSAFLLGYAVLVLRHELTWIPG